MTSFLHENRLGAVATLLAEAGAARVLDLGCGRGDLVMRLLDDPAIVSIVGVERDAAALVALRARLADHPRAGAVRLVEGDLVRPPADLGPVDAAVLVEVIEHLDPARLSALERRVMAEIAPPLVLLTTPNAEMNPLLGVRPGRMRHPDHRFEWDRARFRDWARGVGTRTGYGVETRDVAGAHPRFGGASQMAVFRRLTPRSPAPGEGSAR